MNFETVFENDYQKVSYDRLTRTVWQQYLPPTENMDPETYREQIAKCAKVVHQYDCRTLVTDAREFLFTIPPEMQQGVSRAIGQQLAAAGVSTFVIVGSSDWIVNLSMEQALEEGELVNARPYQIAVVESVEEAYRHMRPA